jgi:peptide/nickel transport system permease protein
MTNLSRSLENDLLVSRPLAKSARRNRRAWGTVSAAIVFAHLILALVAPLLPLQSITAQDAGSMLSGASRAHWLGTDSLGRDVFSRALYGGRPSIAIAVGAALIAALVGVVLGAWAAIAGGWVDEIVMRFVDVLLALPSLLVLLLVASFIGRDPTVLMATLAVMYCPPIARVVRGAVLGVLSRDFVTAARLRGTSRAGIILREVLPNVRGVVITEIAMQFTWILLAFSSLSFLGLGSNPPTPEWGWMIAEARTYLTINPLPLVVPMVMLASLVLAVNAAIDKTTQGNAS